MNAKLYRCVAAEAMSTHVRWPVRARIAARRVLHSAEVFMLTPAAFKEAFKIRVYALILLGATF